MKNKIVIGGYVLSKTDGQKHYVNAKTLCKLYGLNQDECIFAEEKYLESLRGLPRDLEVFKPRYDGKYKRSKDGE